VAVWRRRATGPTPVIVAPVSTSPLLDRDSWIWSNDPVVAADLVGDASEDVVGVIFFIHRAENERYRLIVFDGATRTPMWTSPPLPFAERPLFAATAKRVAVAIAEGVRIYSPASGALTHQLAFDDEIRQLCRPSGSQSEIWVQAEDDAKSALVDVLTGKRRPAPDPPAGCTAASTDDDVPSWAGSRAPQAESEVEGERARLLLEGGIGVARLSGSRKGEELIGAETTGRRGSKVVVTRVLWRSPAEGSEVVLELQDGRAYVRRTSRDEDELVCLDARTGKPVWRAALGSAPTAPARTLTVSARLYLVSGVKLLILDPKTGKVLGDITSR